MPWLLVVLVAGIMQSALLARLTVFGVHPNLVFVLVATWALLRDRREAVAWAMTGGVILDFYSVLPFGTFTMPMLVMAFLLGFVEQLPFQLTLPLAMSIIFVGAILFTILSMIMMQSLGWQVAWNTKWPLLLPIGLVDLLTFVLCYRPMRLLSQLAGGPKIDWK